MTALVEIRLSADEARSLTDQIKTHVAELLPLIKEAFEGRADVALGYANWLDYCDTELTGLRLPIERRREAVAELRQTGMSTPAIGAALRVSDETVRTDLQELGRRGVELPDRVTSLDGRERPATRPAPAMPNGQEVADQIVAGIDQHIAAQPATEPERTTQPSAVQDLIDTDPEVQAVRYHKRFAERLAAVGPVVETDAERIGPLLEPFEVELLERYAASLAEFVEKVRASRRGLRVIKGDK